MNALKKVNDDNNSYVAIKKEVVAAKDIVEEKAEIFDEKANAAKETLTALQASTQIANEAKSSLNNIISSAISTKKELEQAVLETGEVIARVDNAKSNLDKSITSAGEAELNLQQRIDTSNQIKNQLDVSNNTAIELKKNLDVAINEANIAKVKLVEAINNAGNAALENIKAAQNTATQTVETAKVEAVKTLQTEGTTQTGNVTAEGEKQVQAVQTAAQEIIEDREQIAKNATDIADLRQGKADAIIESMSGTLLNVKDSANALFENFSMSGKTTQDGTPTPDAPVEIVNAGQDGTIEIKVTGKNLIPFPYPGIKEIGKTVNYKGVDYTVLQDGGVHLKGTPQYAIGLNICTIPFKDYGKIATSKTIFYDNNNDLTFFYLPKYVGKAIDMVVYPQVEVGTVATPYEPYRQPQTITLQLDRPLTKWDKLEKREGIWGIARNGDRKILDGTGIWYKYTMYENDRLYCYCIEGIKSEIGYQKSYCTHFKNENSIWLSRKGKYGEYSDHETLSNKYFISDKPTVEEFKAWLTQQKEAGTPVELVYKTAEETWEPLPEETQKILNALHTNYPTTVVSNSEETEMELSYIADTKNYTDRKIEEAVSAQTQNLANLLSLMPLSTQAAMIENDTNNILDMEVQK